MMYKRVWFSTLLGQLVIKKVCADNLHHGAIHLCQCLISIFELNNDGRLSRLASSYRTRNRSDASKQDAADKCASQSSAELFDRFFIGYFARGNTGKKKFLCSKHF